MNFTLTTILSHSVWIAAIIGLVRFKKINPAYYPFVLLMWIAAATETAAVIIALYGHTNNILLNIYVLLEITLILWQFKNWGAFRSRNTLFVLLISFLVFWIIECFFIYDVFYTIHYFRIVYSFLIVLLSVNTINKVIVRERKNILKNPVFLICLGFIIYFTIKVLIQVFWMYGLQQNYTFINSVYAIHNYINCLTNLIYALALLWMPTRQRFSLPY